MTGAGGGIGRAAAVRFAQEGATVIGSILKRRIRERRILKTQHQKTQNRFSAFFRTKIR
ncbi:MAG: hypothetical protein ACRDAX_00865 [Propionibacteriaceae bacterium]